MCFVTCCIVTVYNFAKNCSFPIVTSLTHQCKDFMICRHPAVWVLDDAQDPQQIWGGAATSTSSSNTQHQQAPEQPKQLAIQPTDDGGGQPEVASHNVITVQCACTAGITQPQIGCCINAFGGQPEATSTHKAKKHMALVHNDQPLHRYMQDGSIVVVPADVVTASLP